MLQTIANKRAEKAAHQQTYRAKKDEATRSSQKRRRALRSETARAVANVSRRIRVEQSAIWQSNYVSPLTILRIEELEYFPAVSILTDWAQGSWLGY